VFIQKFNCEIKQFYTIFQFLEEGLLLLINGFFKNSTLFWLYKLKIIVRLNEMYFKNIAGFK